MFNRIQIFADWLIYNIINLAPGNHRAQALNFFVYDGIKIFLLLIVIIHIMTTINKYLPVEKIRDFLTKRKRYWLDHLLASFFGTITPFCSCSSIPLFVGFLKSWVPLWVTLSFLITSPLVNEVAIALFLWIFGVKITIIYMLTWVVLGTFWGFVLWKLWLEKYVADFVQKAIDQWRAKAISVAKVKFSLLRKTIVRESRALIKKIMPYVLVGIAIWWIIHGFVPTGFFEKYLSKGSRYEVPLAVIFWVPVYTNASGVIPIVQSLIAKWIPLGTGLSFMMAVVGLSLPEFLILKKVMKMRLLLSFFWFVTFCIILIWFLFNWFL